MVLHQPLKYLLGALKDHKRAILLGENSYGKGSVQSIIPLRNGGGNETNYI